LIVAAIWHISITSALFAVGKFQLAPSQIYPNGIGRFAADGVIYQDQCVELCRILRTEGLAAWASWPTQLHLRLYSLPVAPVSRWITFNILAIEPLNLLYYLTTLVLVFKLAEAIFDHRSAWVATGIVAVWPSLLIHSTQLLRDPLLILAVLILVWTVVEALRRGLRFGRGLLMGVAATAAIVIIRIVRLPMWYLVCAAVGTAILLLAMHAWRKRQVVAGTVVFAVLIIAAVVATPRFQVYFHNQQELRSRRMLLHEEVQKLPIEEQIAARRTGFNSQIDEQGNIAPSEAGSRIDTEVKVRSSRDVIRQLPRAIVVGFFAPFPNLWLRAGREVGTGGRVVSGFETLLTYMLECVGLFGLWRARRRPAAWFLFVFIAIGAIALGLAVNNMGALYRLRYPFWILMVILGAGGLDQFRRTLLTLRSKVV
jgi:hypothetical protein